MNGWLQDTCSYFISCRIKTFLDGVQDFYYLQILDIGNTETLVWQCQFVAWLRNYFSNHHSCPFPFDLNIS